MYGFIHLEFIFVLSFLFLGIWKASTFQMAILLQYNTEDAYTVQQLTDSTQIKMVVSYLLMSCITWDLYYYYSVKSLSWGSGCWYHRKRSTRLELFKSSLAFWVNFAFQQWQLSKFHFGSFETNLKLVYVTIDPWFKLLDLLTKAFLFWSNRLVFHYVLFETAVYEQGYLFPVSLYYSFQRISHLLYILTETKCEWIDKYRCMAHFICLEKRFLIVSSIWVFLLGS